MTITAERLSGYLFSEYVLPAREGHEEIIMVPVRQVWKALEGEFPLGLIRGILGSMRFRNTHHLALVAVEGSREQEPDTYVFKLLEQQRTLVPAQPTASPRTQAETLSRDSFDPDRESRPRPV